MVQQVNTYVENNFTKGLITEATGLNFPEHAATDTDNCEYTLIGDVLRRQGIDIETNGVNKSFSLAGKALSSYVWKNAGGDGETQYFVQQVGNTLYFYKTSSATTAVPLSSTLLLSTVTIDAFVAIGNTFDPTIECQFTDGNGYLFVYHPTCDPFYCTRVPDTPDTITAKIITINIRDFTGVSEPSIAVNTRPLAPLSNEHLYNLLNQGWTQGSPWRGISATPFTPSLGSKVFNVAAGMTVTLGDFVQIINNHDAFPGLSRIPAGTILMSGSVTAYSGTNLTVNVVSFYNPFGSGTWADWQINPVSSGYINSWFVAVGNYPSNADVWWYFKTSAGVFSPATTNSQITLNTGPAPSGHFTVNAFNQQRSLLSGVTGLTDIVTKKRPSTGTWFQGRVWYTGIDDQQVAVGNADYYTWTENIYFSQIVKTPADFGNCFQTNDSTSEQLFDLLPSDGGVITIQGSGKIYKLFPLQNALLVFAANGVWYITGSQGIGFTANDYTIIKLSAIRSISGTSFVNVNGLPYFWNEEGIYAVEPAKQGTGLLGTPLHQNPLEVNPLTVGTIQTFYIDIPAASKKYVRGDYNPIEYRIQWVYRSADETDITSRYQFNRILNYNTFNKAFYPYTLGVGANVHNVTYISNPSLTAPDPVFKYFISNTSGDISTFADEHDTSYRDWTAFGTPINYISYFVTGFKLLGQGIKKFQPQYIQLYSNVDELDSGFKIQGLWNYATNR